MNTEITNLKAALPLIADVQKGFAESLIAQFESKGKLSEKQWFWVKKLGSLQPEPRKEEVEVGSMKGLISLFSTAGEKLKYPAISLQLHSGQPVTLKISGAASKTPGYIQVSDGGSWGNNTWFGRVSPVGQWEQSRVTQDSPSIAKELHSLLRSMSTDPAATAAAYGKLTGRCCFCNKKLEDEKSTGVGYGPVCAKNYGLPWGKAH